MTLPRRHTSAMSRQIQVVLVVFGVAQRRRLGVDLVILLADVRRAQDVHAFGIRRHHAVLDAVVDHLHEMAGAVRAAMEVALLGRSARLFASGGAVDVADTGRQSGEDRGRDV